MGIKIKATVLSGCPVGAAMARLPQQSGGKIRWRMDTMRNGETRTTMRDAAERFRALVLESEDGAFIGTEDALIVHLGCSRATIRQAARLLEREGLLRVKRGLSGGYFGSRPDAATIEATMAAYLETLDMDPQDVTTLASALWVEAMRKAAAADREQVLKAVTRLRGRVNKLKNDAKFSDIQSVELDMQSEVFRLAKSTYIKLIFDVNVAFSARKFGSAINDDDTDYHRDFVPIWKDAKLLELLALSGGDREVAVMASQYARKIWHQRVWRRYGTHTDTQ